ncbi:MAG: hypothetical protein ACREK1_12835 [Longimicrobiales bacterium]
MVARRWNALIAELLSGRRDADCDRERRVQPRIGSRPGAGSLQQTTSVIQRAYHSSRGEPSAGAANLNSYYDINDRFRISVSTGAPVNPITNTNWEGTGVQPDAPVPAGEAVSAAHVLALRTLLRGATDAENRERLAEAITRSETALSRP